MNHPRRHSRPPLTAWLLFAVLLVAPHAMAQSTGAFARLGFGARGMSMGNALVADGSGQAGAFYNPALAPLVDRQGADASFGLLTLDRTLQHLQVSFPLKPQAGLAAGLIHAGVSGIDGRDASGYHTRELSTSEYLFFFAFGLKFGSKASAGLGLRLYRNDLYDDLEAANSLGLSVGLLLRPLKHVTVGLAIDDLLAKYDWDTSTVFGEDGRKTTDRFPTRFRGGLGWAIDPGRLFVLVEYESLVNPVERSFREVVLIDGVPVSTERFERLDLHSGRVRAGMEWWPIQPVALRLGIDRVGEGDAGDITPSTGFALVQDIGQLGVQIDYAFTLEPYLLGTMHMVTLHLTF
jgi:hypothetical protein